MTTITSPHSIPDIAQIPHPTITPHSTTSVDLGTIGTPKLLATAYYMTTTSTTFTTTSPSSTFAPATPVQVSSLSRDDDRDIFYLLVVWFSLTLGRFVIRSLGKMRRGFRKVLKYRVKGADVEAGQVSVNSSARSKRTGGLIDNKIDEIK